MPGIATEDIFENIGFDPAPAYAHFKAVYERDAAHRNAFDWADSWRHLRNRLAQGALKDMMFEDFIGAEHLARMFGWIENSHFPNFVQDRAFDDSIALAAERDRNALIAAGLDPAGRNIANVALYNAQDYRFQTFLPVPERQRIRTFVDFGAGHGRQANLWFALPNSLDAFIAIDATPAPYLTQILYYRLLGLEVEDYLVRGEQWKVLPRPGTVHHLPSWRLDMIADQSVDLICAVQVLRELSKPMLVHALTAFRRMLKPGGSLYIRDHFGFHSVNQVDLDRLLLAFGFVVEWQPNVVDRVDVHGIPRIWRLPEVEALIGGFREGAGQAPPSRTF